MINNTNLLHITGLNLLASAACNLQCDYCLIAKRDKKLHTHDFYTATCEAFEDGTYLKNVLKTLERLNQKRSDIVELEIWGQEPTTTLPHFSAHIKDWLEAFPNLARYNFSTNLMLSNWSDIIYDYILAIDNATKIPASINIQLSFDSIGSYLARGGDNEIMLNNILSLLDKLNTVQFKRSFVHFSVHSVVSFTMIENIKKDNTQIKTFLDSYCYFNKSIASKIINRNVTYYPCGIQYQNGGRPTTQETYDFYFVLQQIETYAQQHKEEYKDYLPWINGCFTFPMLVCGHTAKSLATLMPQELSNLDTYIQALLDDNSPLAPAHSGLYCFSLAGQLKMLYDGTYAPCQNYIYDSYFYQHDLPLPEENFDDRVIKYAITRQSVNFLTSTDQEIEEIINWDNQFTHKKSFLPFMSIISGKIIQLAAAGQVSRKYLWDRTLLIRHSFLIAINQPCHYNNMYFTGSIYNKSFAEIKFLCNVIAPQIEDALNTLQHSSKLERFNSVLVEKQNRASNTPSNFAKDKK